MAPAALRLAGLQVLNFPGGGAARLSGLRVWHCLWSGSPDRHNVPPPGKGLLRSRISPYALAVHPRLADITLIAQGHQDEQLLIDILAAPAA